MSDFCHLHCHTSYSLLDGAARIDALIGRAKKMGMFAIGITDHGNLFGVPEFYTTAKEQGIRPVIGCEFYVTAGSMQERDRVRYHQVLWAKNEEGYRHLMQLSSLSYTDGYYYKPRIDHEALKKYSAGLIATTCCLQGEVPQAILKNEEEESARRIFEQYLDLFGEDYYIELQNHDIQEQAQVNAVLLRWAKEYNVRVVATNDVHYVDRLDAEAQDVLLCLQTGKDLKDPARIRFENDQFYLKTGREMETAMAAVDADIVQESLHTSREIADKCNVELQMGNLLMPHYPIPEAFDNNVEKYLSHLVFESARKRYPTMPQEVTERLQHELGIIGEMGYAGYFLVVQDFTTAARKLGVSVGPGRGSAAGSAVAYCLGITNIDPLPYGLLFERFLNPERVSMPDIDIDFDDRGRAAVIEYVVKKYGRENVCQIVTFGTMGARSVIRDVARVLGIHLSEADRIAKMIPEGPKVSLDLAMKTVREFAALKEDPRLEIRQLMRYAKVLEGSARHTGVHAAGVIIAPGRVSDYVPVARAKNKGDQVITTQYDGNWVEKFGLLKMDFLGLSTLTILKDAVARIQENRGITLDLDAVPLDDAKTYELFQRGDTVGIFQFESEGMRNWLTQLKPTRFDDLVAMNALYRPGPMDLISNYVKRKHGKEEIAYPHEMLKPVLESTYGIPVYQEQVMQMAQVMGGYTLGRADLLRRAMGKKKKEEMAKQRAIFVEGAGKRGVEEKVANDAFDMMAKFAGYGFNKCLVGTTVVMDARSGQRYTLEELFVTQTPIMVHALGAGGRLRARHVTDVVWNGYKPVFELQTYSGRKITATANHPFLTPGGWTHLEHLSPGDRVGAPRVLELAAHDAWPQRNTFSERTAQDVRTFPLWLGATSSIFPGGHVPVLAGAQDTQLFQQRVALQTAGGEGCAEDAVKRVHADVVWDTVVSITCCGVQETFDLTVNGDHNFVADGLIVHNSHSAAYSLVAYQTAYLKTHYSAEFLAACMTNDMGDPKKLANLLEQTRKLQITLQPPSINHSQRSFTVEEGKIRCGLGAIKGVGKGPVEVIVDARKEHGPARTFFGWAKTLDVRALGGKKTLECLARAGALDELEGHRAQFVAAAEIATQYALKQQEEKRLGQGSLFGDVELVGITAEPSLPSVDPWSKTEMLKEERDMIGFYITGHPLEAYRPEARSFATANLGTVAGQLPPEQASGKQRQLPVRTFCGIITEVQERVTKKGKPIAYLTLEDFTGQGKVVCFATIIEKVHNYLKVEDIVLVRGEVQIRGGSVEVLARDVIPMWKLREQMVKAIVVRIDQKKVGLETIKEFRTLCDENRGSCHLYFDVLDEKLPGGCQRVRSRSYVVDLTPELMQGVTRLFGVKNVLLEGNGK